MEFNTDAYPDLKLTDEEKTSLAAEIGAIEENPGRVNIVDVYRDTTGRVRFFVSRVRTGLAKRLFPDHPQVMQQEAEIDGVDV